MGGVQQADTNLPPQVMQDNAAPFSFVVPTEFVELPSGGKFYPEGHPLHAQESIEIRQMTAKEEDMLTSRTLLKKGIALDRVIGSLIVDKRINPDALLIGDRNAIIIATRVSAYGNDYTTKVTCPSCMTVQEFAFDLNSANIYQGETEKEGWIINDNNNGTFNLTLPKTRVVVTFRMLTGRDEKAIFSGMEQDRKQKKHEQNITRQLKNIVVAVNDDASPQAIDYLIANIPSVDARHIRLAYRFVAPNVDLTQDFECAECQFAQEMEVPLSADFFWPDR
jgi:hypothetical protein